MSGSADAMLHVWALPSILSFSPDASRSPVHTFSTHRGPISSVAYGHSWSSANIAISISEDKSAIVWDYHNGQALRIYLLADVPTAIALDPADRAFYVAFSDGSLQVIDFYDDVQQTTSVDILREPSSSHRPVQLSPKTRFNAESQKLGATLSLNLSWDGTTLLSGHESGKVAAWDVAKKTYLSTVANLPGPVSNLDFISPTGFPDKAVPALSIQAITKPKQGDLSRDTGSGLIPPNYTLNVQLSGRLHSPNMSPANKQEHIAAMTIFDEALTHPTFPDSLLEEGLAELETWGAHLKGAHMTDGEFISLTHGENDVLPDSFMDTAEVQELKKQLASLQRIQKVTFSQLSELREENKYFLGREQKRADRAKERAQRKPGLTNGTNSENAAQDVDMEEIDDVSSGSD